MIMIMMDSWSVDRVTISRSIEWALINRVPRVAPAAPHSNDTVHRHLPPPPCPPLCACLESSVPMIAPF